MRGQVYVYLFNIYYAQCRNEMKCEKKYDLPIICHSSVRWGKGLSEWENEWIGLKKKKKKQTSVPQKVQIQKAKELVRKEWMEKRAINFFKWSSLLINMSIILFVVRLFLHSVAFVCLFVSFVCFKSSDKIMIYANY